MKKIFILIQILSLMLASCGGDENSKKTSKNERVILSEENITYISKKAIRSIEDVSALVRATTIIITSSDLPDTEQRVLDCPGGGTEEIIFLDNDDNYKLTDGDQLTIIDYECKTVQVTYQPVEN